VRDPFNKEVLIGHRVFPLRRFDQQHLRPIAEHATIKSYHAIMPRSLS
jgi:hypothetical protein